MSDRNNYTRRGGKYRQRGGNRNYRPEPNRQQPVDTSDSLVAMMETMDRSFKFMGNSTQPNREKYKIDRRQPVHSRINRNPQKQMGWWRVTIQQAGSIGKDIVLSTLITRCAHPFQAYHYFIDSRTGDGVFFVNNQSDADMIKRNNGKVEIRGMDILRIQVNRVPIPLSKIDADLRPHLKDYLLNRRFNRQTFQLDLSNLADDEELSTLGIFPQCNKLVFISELIDIINKELPLTRQLDFGSNNITNLNEFRNLHLNSLTQLSFASNQLRSVDDFDNLNHLSQLVHIYIKNNPITLSNKKQNSSMNDIISTIQKKLPKLKRIDDTDLTPIILLPTDLETVNLPPTVAHCVPHDIQPFLAKFIEEFYRLFDTRGRGELHACYHESCMFSLCISTWKSSLVPARIFTFGSLINNSRNLHKVTDDNRRFILLQHGRSSIVEFFKVKFPSTKHDGNSFHVDVISTANNRAIFTINGLYKEVNQTKEEPIRCFQRTFTCVHTSSGVLIIADHLMLCNATEHQISKMMPSSTTSSQNPHNQSDSQANIDAQKQHLIHNLSLRTTMNFEYSKLCLEQNNWDYDKAVEVFLDLQRKSVIPPEAFNKN